MTVRVEVVDPTGIRHGPEHYVCGDIVECAPGRDEVILNRWVVAGWARDLDTGEQREPVTGRVHLHVHDTMQRMTTTL